METMKGDNILRNEEKVQPTEIMTTVEKHHKRNKQWVVREVWLYLNTVEEDSSAGNLLCHAHFGVCYRTGYHLFRGK
jgi:hypothetical protein